MARAISRWGRIGDEGEGAAGGGRVVAQRIGDARPTGQTEQADERVAAGRQRLGAVAAALLAGGLAHGHGADAMDPLPDDPVAAPEVGDALDRPGGAARPVMPEVLPWRICPVARSTAW